MATTYMALVLPTVNGSSDTWGTELNTALTALDSHDHSTGKGTKITPAGLNVNADLELNDFALTEIQGTQFQDQAADPVGISKRRRCYVKSGELYFIDDDGNIVQITANGTINAASVGGITGLTSPAACTYSSITTAFAFTSTASTPAGLDSADHRIAEKVANGKGPVLKAAAGTAADYDWFFPAALPGVETALTVTAGGQIAFEPISFTHVTAGMPVGYGYTQTATQFTGITNQIPNDATIPQITEGTEIITLAYTPKKTGNILVIESVLEVSHGNSGSVTGAVVALFRDAVVDAMAAVAIDLPDASYKGTQVVLLRFHYIAPGTSAITFRIRVGRSAAAGIVEVNVATAGNVNSDFSTAGPFSTLRVTEIAA